MEEQQNYRRNKGGRPKKETKRDLVISMKCSSQERRIIEERSQSLQLSVSEYLRELGLTGKIASRNKALPREVLLLTATLNHLAANINQIAKKRNGMDELNTLERANLRVQSLELKELAATIKTLMK
jgi:transcription termination factor NusB